MPFMRPDRMTTTFQTALAEAQSLALGRDHQFIEPLHMMTVLLDQEDGSVQPLLLQAGVNINLVRARLGQALDRVPRVEGTGGEVLIARDLERVLNLMDKLAQTGADWRARGG
jgi:ATP-dependent Clp protease ATP-binding subunit ClpB